MKRATILLMAAAAILLAACGDGKSVGCSPTDHDHFWCKLYAHH